MTMMHGFFTEPLELQQCVGEIDTIRNNLLSVIRKAIHDLTVVDSLPNTQLIAEQLEEAALLLQSEATRSLSYDEIINTHVQAIGVATRLANLLEGAGYETVFDILSVTDSKLKEIPDVSDRSVTAIIKSIALFALRRRAEGD